MEMELEGARWKAQRPGRGLCGDQSEDGGAFMEKGFGHFESGAGYFYLYSGHIWALNHGEYRKIKCSVLRLIDLNGRLIHFNISLSDHLLYGSAALMIKFKS